MKIVQHRLQNDDGEPFAFVESPNRGGKLEPQYLVMHYTAGGTATGAIRTLTDPAAKASAHVVIARDGEITQLVAFDEIAWHAGRSRWQGLDGLNRHSIGIEMDNAGVLDRQEGRWRAWFGAHYKDEDVIEAVHQHGGAPRGWHTYTPAQLDAAIALGRVLVENYRLRDIIGHDDIAPGRKLDPGPAFPMASYRSALMGRRDDMAELFKSTTQLNIREGPGTGFAKLGISPLAPGTRLRLDRREASWYRVEVLDKDGLPSDTGWVHGDYIAPV